MPVIAVEAELAERLAEQLRNELVCQVDETVCADGQIRRLPSGVDPVGPIVAYSLHTADDCVKHLVYGLGDSGQLVEIADSGWGPTEPDLETIRADIEIHHARDDQDQAELTGDQHRALEDGGLLGVFLLLLAKRDPDGADELLDEVSGRHLDRRSP